MGTDRQDSRSDGEGKKRGGGRRGRRGNVQREWISRGFTESTKPHRGRWDEGMRTDVGGRGNGSKRLVAGTRPSSWRPRRAIRLSLFPRREVKLIYWWAGGQFLSFFFKVFFSLWVHVPRSSVGTPPVKLRVDQKERFDLWRPASRVKMTHRSERRRRRLARRRSRPAESRTSLQPPANPPTFFSFCQAVPFNFLWRGAAREPRVESRRVRRRYEYIHSRGERTRRDATDRADLAAATGRRARHTWPEGSLPARGERREDHAPHFLPTGGSRPRFSFFPSDETLPSATRTRALGGAGRVD